MVMSPFVFFFSLLDPSTDIWDAIKLTMAVDLGIACVGVGCLVMVDGGLLPL
jgi:hypothetical protein